MHGLNSIARGASAKAKSANNTMITVNGRLLIVAMYSDNQGFDIFVPVPHKNDIIDALKAAELACGIRFS
jgi:hypothetical protein